MSAELQISKVKTPAHLLHIQCECGNEAFIGGKPDGWRIDIRGHIDFLCPCGKLISTPKLEEKDV